MTRHEWVSFVKAFRRTLDEFDEAWTQYQASVTRFNQDEMEAPLEAAVKKALQGIEGLIERFPELEQR